MKIGIDISQSVYFGTGVASYTRNLINAITKLTHSHKFVLFGSSLRRQKDLKKFLDTLGDKSLIDSRIIMLPPTLLDIIWNRLHIIDVETFTGKIDLFHTSDWTEPPSDASKVTTIHDLIVYKFPEHLDKEIVNTQLSKLAWVKKESAMIIADSQSTKKDIMTYLNIPESIIKVVYLGVDPVFNPQPVSRIEELR